VFVTKGLYKKSQEVLLHLPDILNIWKINLCVLHEYENSMIHFIVFIYWVITVNQYSQWRISMKPRIIIFLITAKCYWTQVFCVKFMTLPLTVIGYETWCCMEANIKITADIPKILMLCA
jgi:hypothetical protein